MLGSYLVTNIKYSFLSKKEDVMTNLVGNPAPEFKATAVIKNRFIHDFSLSDFLGRTVVFFFYPLDFTFVCPTELHAFQEMQSEFEKRSTSIVACSVDSHFSHAAWLNTPKSQGGIEGINYPIVADLTKEIARAYGVLKENEGVALRGLFILDKKGIIRHALINDLPIGRSVEEAIRIVDAIEYHEKNGEVCPANWTQGSKGLKATADGVKAYFS
jgi:peroxiredoxin (alkyl hydroperoxide reductase subunit C)